MRAPILAAAAALIAGLAIPAAAAGSHATPASAPTVVARSLPGYGTVLAIPSGQALYVLTNDPAGATRCYAACTKSWRPLIASGAPVAGAGANASLLSTFRRTDGRRQVMYDHRALYLYAGSDQAAGAGSSTHGGIWVLVSPSGKAIKQTTSGGY
jgi:predicted lipoprotein with Yx(FWY)xxD motif